MALTRHLTAATLGLMAKPVNKKPPTRAEIQQQFPQFSDYQADSYIINTSRLQRIDEIYKVGMTGDRLFTALIVILCGLPLRPTKEERVVRIARLADGTILRVTFGHKHAKVGIPYGADITLLYFLTNMAVLQQSPVLLEWKYAKQYMEMMGLDPNQGANHRAVQERFTRLAYMYLLVEVINPGEQTGEPISWDLFDRTKVGIIEDGDDWRPSMSVGQMLRGEQPISLGPRFFFHLVDKNAPYNGAVPIPLELIRVSKKRYQILGMLVFMYWRAFAGQSESFIPWSALEKQFDHEIRPRRWRAAWQEAYTLLKSCPPPLNDCEWKIEESGLRLVRPYPIRTAIFKDHPKLGYKPENRTVLDLKVLRGKKKSSNSGEENPPPVDRPQDEA